MMGETESMRREWDARARKDAFYYIASWRKGWSVGDFLESGEEDYQRLVEPALNRLGFSPSGKTMLELGCGAGRMTHSFAARFAQVLASDLSAQMLERARKILPGVANITWIQSNGTDLGGIPSESVDFAFSYLVLQHLPEEKLVYTYVREMLRVLGDSGLCLFQVNGTKRPTMNWQGRLAWGLVDGLWAIHLPHLARTIARLLGLDPEMAGKSWHGTAVGSESILKMVSASGANTLEVWGDDTPMLWFCAKKTRASSLEKSAAAT
jgi:SAM-dependent methyltransferase